MRTSTAAVLGDLGWRMFYTRAIYQAVSLWMRITDMSEACLLRKAMYVQRQYLDVQMRGKGMGCWLSFLRDSVSQYPMGKAMWDTWIASCDFRVCTSRLVAAEGNGCLPDSGAGIQRLTAAVAFH